MRVYHGSSVAVSVPEIRRGRFSKDFGDGFYCTTLLEQAKRWASRKKPSVVSAFEYLPSESLNVLEFTEMTDEWLDFIVNCRRGASHDYVDGILTKEQFWVLAKFKKHTNQICFCSENALKCLKYIESLNIDCFIC